MTNNLKLFHLSLIKLYEDFDNDSSRELVQLAYAQLSEDEKDLMNLVCNAEVSEIIY